MKKYLFLIMISMFVFTSCTDKGSKEDGLITLRIAGLETDGKSFDKIIAGYKTVNPNINIELFKAPDFVALNQAVLASYQAGDAYDLAVINHVDTMSFARAGVLEPLDELIARDNIDYSSMIFQTPLKGGIVDGKQYGISFSADVRLLALNKDLFIKHGQEVPKTMDDMLVVASALTKDGDYGYVNSMTRNDYVSTYEQGVFLIASGGQLYKIADDGNVVASIDTPEMKKYLTFNKELLKYMPANALTMTEDQGRAAFLSGNIGMYIYGPWEFDYITDEMLDFDLVTIPIPEGDAGSKTVSGGFQLALCAGSQNPQEAWDLFKYITTSVENMAIMSGTSMPSVMAGYDIAPFNGEKYAMFRSQIENSYIPPAIGNLQEVVSKFSEYWAAILYDKMTIDEATKEAQIEVQKLLDVNNK